MKKIAFIGYNDSANCMTEYSQAINQHCDEFESKSICIESHPILYSIPHDYDIRSSNVEQRNEIKEWLMECSHIIIGEEMRCNFPDMSFILNNSITEILGIPNFIKNELGLDLVLDTLAGRTNKLHLYYTGSFYRSRSHIFNIIGGKYFDKVLYCIDLYRLSWNKDNPKRTQTFSFPDTYSFKNNLAIHVACDPLYKKEILKDLIETKFNSDKILIFHATTSKTMKGTDIITKITEEVIKEINLISPITYQLITTENYSPLKETIKNGWVPHKEIMKIKEQSHIYIDEFNPSVGYFGVSGVESLMMGNITMATINNLTPESEISSNSHLTPPGSCPVIHLGENPEQFKQILKETLNKPLSELKELAYQSLEWYFKTSTYKAVATKFKKEILI